MELLPTHRPVIGDQAAEGEDWRLRLHAVALAELGLPGLEARDGRRRPSLAGLLDEETHELPLRSAVRAALQPGPPARERIRAAFGGRIDDEGIERALDDLAVELDRALGRWRVLYRSFWLARERADRQLRGGLLRPHGPAWREQLRLHVQCTSALALLRNESDGTGSAPEFDPWRYLAAEGFLPPGGMPRSPLRLFLAGADGQGRFISRPRFAALREFAPLSLVEHQGRMYRVRQWLGGDVAASLHRVRVCHYSGCLLWGEQRTLEFCPVSGAPLADAGRCEHLHDLLDAADARADEVGCDAGDAGEPDIATYFSLDSEQALLIRRATFSTEGKALLKLTLMPALRLVQVLRGRRGELQEGCTIALDSGGWPEGLPQRDTACRRVMPWTSAPATAIHIEPLPPLRLDPGGVADLQPRLLRAIARRCGARAAGIGAVSVGAAQAPCILLHEAADGCAGILSQLAAGALQAVLAQALGELDERHLRCGALCLPQDGAAAGEGGHDRQFEWLMAQLEPAASAARHFLKHLHARGLRLPDAVRPPVEGLYLRPDFLYAPRIWVFCDGAAHGDLLVQESTVAGRDELLARGDEVWVWHVAEDLAAKVAQRPDIFGRAP